MALVLKDRVRETATVVGTGDAALLGAVTGFQSFSVVGNTNTCYYAIADQSGGDWEVGIGTYSTTGPTLARTTVLASSNSGSKVSFTGGTKDVFLTYPSEKAVYLDASDVLNVVTIDATTLEVTNIKAQDGTAAITLAGSTGVATFTANPILNAATANGVVYANGSKVLATGSALTFDGSSLAVTLGSTTTPSVRLYYNGSSQYGLHSMNPNGDYVVESPALNGVTSGQLYLKGNAAMLFGVAGSEQMRLTSTGLGIGTSTAIDNAKLSVYGTYAAFANGTYKGYVGQASALSTGGATVDLAIRATEKLWLVAGASGAASAVLDSSGNLGLGVTPSAWAGRAIQIGTYSGYGVDANGYAFMSNNAYDDTSSSYRYVASGLGSGLYRQEFGAHKWFTAPSGTAGNAISFTQAMTLDASGNLGIGTSSPGYKLDVSGTSRFSQPVDFGGGQVNTAGSGAYKAANFGAASGAYNVLYSGSTSFNINNNTDTAGLLTLTNSGNLGLGVTPSAWDVYKGSQVIYGALASSANAANNTLVTSNAYYNAGFKFMASGATATAYQQETGAHKWYTTGATTGTAGNAISFTQAMTLDASGNLGIGTSSPSSYIAGLAVNPTTNGSAIAAGNGAWISGFSSDAAFANASLSNSGVWYAKSAGAGIMYASSSGYLGFYTNSGLTAGNAFSATERMRIDSSGNVLVGTTSVLTSNVQGLQIVGNPAGGYSPIAIRNTNASAGKYHYIGPDSSGAFLVYNQAGTGVYVANNATSWTGTSDERLKTNLKPIEDAVNKVKTLRSVTGRFKTDEEGVSRSFLIAQDVQKVLPEAVDASNPECLGVAYTDVIPLLVAAIKEQQELINQLTARVAQLEGN